MGAGIGDGNSKLFTALATAAVLEEALKGIAYTKIVAFDGGTNTVEHCVIKDFDQKEIGSRCIDAMGQIAAGNRQQGRLFHPRRRAGSGQAH